MKLFTDLYAAKQASRGAKKRAIAAVETDIADLQGEIAAQVVVKKKKLYGSAKKS